MAAQTAGKHRKVWLAMALLAASGAGVSIWGSLRASRLKQSVTALEQEGRALEAQIANRTQLTADLKTKLRAAGQQVAAPVVAPPKDSGETAARIAAIHTVAELQAQMQALTNSAAEAEARNRQLETQSAAAQEERTRLSTLIAETTAKLNELNLTVTALEGQIKQKDQRLNPLEAENRSLQGEEMAVRERLAGVSSGARELAEIRRRRESLVESLMRNFRDLGDQYRTLAARLDRTGDTAGFNPGDLSRIQAALSQADEDVRQINALNQKAAALIRSLK